MHKLRQRNSLWGCQVRVTVGDSGLCCCVCLTSLKRWLTPLCVDSARALWASFCFRFLISKSGNFYSHSLCASFQALRVVSLPEFLTFSGVKLRCYSQGLNSTSSANSARFYTTVHPLTYMGRTKKECTVRTHSFTSLLKHYFGDTHNYYTTVIEHRGSISDRNRGHNIPVKTFLENHISDRDMIKLWGTIQHVHHNIGWVLDKMLLVHKDRKRRRQDPFLAWCHKKRWASQHQ